jgi:hypothetical protein
MLDRASRCNRGALCRSNKNAAYEARVKQKVAQVTVYFLKIFLNRSQTMYPKAANTMPPTSSVKAMAPAPMDGPM